MILSHTNSSLINFELPTLEPIEYHNQIPMSAVCVKLKVDGLAYCSLIFIVGKPFHKM